MKKILSTTLAATAFAASAHAGSINFDTRIDYQSVDYNSAAETAAPAKNADNSHIYFKTGRLDYKGNLNDETSYRFRLSFAGSPADTARDNLTSATQYAYLTQKLNPTLTLSIGKLASEIGGFEGPTASSELYLTSEAYTHKFGAAALGSKTFGYGDSSVLYMTGLKAEYAIVDQTITAVILNPTQDEKAAAGAFSQNSNAFGFIYKGNFMEKSLGVIASYHEFRGTNGTNSGDDKTKFYSIGLKWDASPVVVTAEHNFQNADYSATTDKMASTVVKAAYTGIENWTPRFELTSSKEDIGAATNTFMGYGAVLEYKARKEESFRYHVAYQNITGTPNTGSDLNRQEIVIGTRLMADFLK